MLEWAVEELRVKPPMTIPLLPFQVLSTLIEGACRHLGIKPPLYRSRLDFFSKS